MKSHPRYKYTLDDLFLDTFVYVDDWLQENQAKFQLPQKSNQVASYSELFTIVLVGELQAQAYESIWYWKWSIFLNAKIKTILKGDLSKSFRGYLKHASFQVRELS